MNAKRTVDPRVDRICAELATVRAEYRTVRNEFASVIAERDRIRAERDDLADVLRELLAEVEDFHVSTGHEEEGGSVQCDEICALMPKARAALAKAGAP